jgi:hypothetical protein
MRRHGTHHLPRSFGSFGGGCAAALALACALVVACTPATTKKPPASTTAGLVATTFTQAPASNVSITATVGSTRFVTREHFLAAGEMQISGEPLAEVMQRDLSLYGRTTLPTDLYSDPARPWIDLPGFSTAVESYEYSKQPMNFTALESAAGTSLVHGPLVDVDGTGGPAATAAMAALVQRFASESNALGRFVFPPNTFPAHNARNGDRNPNSAGDASENPLGWPGLWPTVHVFASFDPAIAPTGLAALDCAITSDDNVNPPTTPSDTDEGVADYECDASTLHLPNRSTQIDATITPGADGFATWKYGLWVLNYLQVMHDSVENAVSSVNDGDLANVGSAGNTIVGDDDTGAATLTGTFIGSSDIEGFQAAMFIAEVDNRAEDWLAHLATRDATTLTGFASIGDALAYDEQTPLTWFPGSVAVSERDDGSGFPAPTYSIKSADSDLLDLAGLAMGYAEFHALTDTANVDVGGAQSALAYFDGDPFAADDQLADGEATLHDRSLAMMRVALVNMDRLHFDSTSGVLVDHVTLAASPLITPRPGTTASTIDAAYALLSLRTVLRSLHSELELYSNNTPDTAIVGDTALDSFPLHAAAAGAGDANATVTFTGRVRALIDAESSLLFDHLTDRTGRAFSAWDTATNTPVDDSNTLDAHAAAVRGLFAAYLASGDVKYRERALAVFARMEHVFYDADARIFSNEAAPVDDVEMTPLRFALLQSALRDVYEIVATAPGGESAKLDLESKIGRLDKLVLNGWDDRNQDRLVQWPDECVNVVDSLPRGGLQMAERTLTGETGSLVLPHQGPVDPDGGHRKATQDRDKDCVPEIDDAKLPAALADSITFHIARTSSSTTPLSAPLPSHAPTRCVATFSGNINGTIASSSSCAQLGADGTLHITTPTIASPDVEGELSTPSLDVTITLGANASIGAFSSETATSWSANGTSPVEPNCVYVAGVAAVPSGDFALELTATSPQPHGKLAIDASLESSPLTACGPVDVESITVEF